jgi:hypothetical protein
MKIDILVISQKMRQYSKRLTRRWRLEKHPKSYIEVEL